MSGKVTLSPLLARWCGQNRMPTIGPPVWMAPDARRRPAGVDGTGCPLSAPRCGRNRMPTVGLPVWTASDTRCWPAGVDGTGCPPGAEAEDVSLTRPLDLADDWSASPTPPRENF